MKGLDAKDEIMLRLKCLEPFITVASKHSIEKSVVFEQAEKAWEFATRTLVLKKAESPE